MSTAGGPGDEAHIEEAVNMLKAAYRDYCAALKTVLEYGDDCIPVLTKALDKFAIPVVHALGLQMDSPAADSAIPELIEYSLIQSPIYTDVCDALRRAGVKAVPHLVKRLRQACAENDSDAVWPLLCLAPRLSGDANCEAIVDEIAMMLQHADFHIRYAAADAVADIGLPYGRRVIPLLRELAARETDKSMQEIINNALVRLGCDD